MKHTPGPWTIGKCKCGDPVCNDWFVSVTRSDGRVSESDAHLIAAAPDLLKVLQLLLSDNCLVDWHEEKVKAAVHKATGRKS